MAGVVAALVLGPPLLAIWGWTIDRFATSAAVGRALRQGEQALAAGDPVRAIVAFNHARALRPGDARLERAVWRARARFLAEDADRVTVENLEESRYRIEQLVADEPRNAVYLVAQAHVLLRRGQTADAERRLADAVKLEPGSAVAHLARAAFLQRTTSQIDAVMAEYRAVLQLEPRNFAAHLGLGRMHLLRKDTRQEIAEFAEAANIEPASYTAHEALADAYLHQGGDSLIKAWDEYRKAAALQPSSAEAHWGLGIIDVQAKRWKDAEAELRLALKGPRNPEIDFQLGLAIARQNRCQEAMPLFLQLLRDEPRHSAALMEVGACAATLGQKEAATSFYQRVLDLPLPAAGDPRRLEAEKRSALARAELAALGGGAPAPSR